MEEWHARYNHRVEEHALSRDLTKRTAIAEIIGADGYKLLTVIYTTPALNWLHHVPSVQLLRRVWLQQFEMVDGQVHFRSNDNIPSPAMIMRKQYTAAFKSKVVQELLKEEKTLAQIATEYEVHPTQLKEWRARAV